MNNKVIVDDEPKPVAGGGQYITVGIPGSQSGGIRITIVFGLSINIMQVVVRTGTGGYPNAEFKWNFIFLTLDGETYAIYDKVSCLTAFFC